MAIHRAEEVLDFWFGKGDERGKPHKRWFTKDPVFDAAIRDRFLALYEETATGGLREWLDEPGSCLARILVLDQFPRNVLRGSARASRTDSLALAAAPAADAAGR